MSQGYFQVKSKLKLDELELNTRIEESDFASLTPNGTFVQLEYIETDESGNKYKVKPGIWAITKDIAGLKLTPTSFVRDRILESFINTKTTTEVIDCFFNNIHVYYEEGYKVPKRAALLYGSAGTGKTTIINQACTKYAEDGKTAVVVWHTSRFEAYDVKQFIKSFEYEGVEKLILVIEDIGGMEVAQVKLRSDSSLLSLLDNQEETFTIPVFILATTNFPEVFLGNLTNRPQRFDDKIEVGYPSKDQRIELYKFFNNKENDVSEEELVLIGSDKCKEFSPAHLKEIRIRSRIFNKSRAQVIRDILKEVESFKKDFQKSSALGFSS